MNDAPLGTHARPLRVAIVGSGPSGFYAAEHLFAVPDLAVQIDMFDRLPTPFGLVRGGVAPDHQKIKSVTRVYDRIASNPEFRFYGNVEIGRDLSRSDLKAYYHAVIYAVGAKSDRRMGIPGEHLPGSHSATDFVGWYNGHPDFRHRRFDLSARRVAIVGNGNVAMDVARILGSRADDLHATDIAPHALEALAASRVEEIVMLGRRGPSQAAFTPKELRELGERNGLDVVIDPDQLVLDDGSRARIEGHPDRNRDANLDVMAQYAARPLRGEPRRVVLRFLVSPVALWGRGRVEGMRIVHNTLQHGPDGELRPRATARTEDIPVDLVFRAIGYHGTPLGGLPFDARSGTIPNDRGRIVDPMNDNDVLPRAYVVGWIKRGPQGIIGTNKPDAGETVQALLDDMHGGRLTVEVPARDVLERLIRERHGRFVSYDDWRTLDAIERARGEACGRPRVKFTSIEEMLEVVGEAG